MPAASLAAVLEGVEPERRDRRGIGMAEDAENAALLAQGFRVEIAQRATLKPVRLMPFDAD